MTFEEYTRHIDWSLTVGRRRTRQTARQAAGRGNTARIAMIRDDGSPGRRRAWTCRERPARPRGARARDSKDTGTSPATTASAAANPARPSTPRFPVPRHHRSALGRRRHRQAHRRAGRPPRLTRSHGPPRSPSCSRSAWTDGLDEARTGPPLTTHRQLMLPVTTRGEARRRCWDVPPAVPVNGARHITLDACRCDSV